MNTSFPMQAAPVPDTPTQDYLTSKKKKKNYEDI